MNNTLKIGAFALLTSLLLTGFDEANPVEINFGSISEGVYSNSYFDMSIPLPENWVVQSRAEEKALMKTGEDMLAGDNKAMKRAMKEAEKKTVNMFSVFKHELGAAVPFNPSVIALAENMAGAPGVKNGKDYFFHLKRVLEAGQMEHKFPADVYIMELSGKQFHVMPVSIDVGTMTVDQLYFSRLVGEYMLSFILSYSGEEQKNELIEILNGAKFGF